jgi:hypothetical protein
MADFELLRDDVNQIEQTMVDIVLLLQLAASLISNQARVMGVCCARPAIVCGLGQLVL